MKAITDTQKLIFGKNELLGKAYTKLLDYDSEVCLKNPRNVVDESKRRCALFFGTNGSRILLVAKKKPFRRMVSINRKLLEKMAIHQAEGRKTGDDTFIAMYLGESDKIYYIDPSDIGSDFIVNLRGQIQMANFSVDYLINMKDVYGY